MFLHSLRQHDASFFLDADSCLDFIYFVCLQYVRTANMQQAILAAVGSDLHGSRIAPIWKIFRYICANNIAWVIHAERSVWRLIFLDNATEIPFITGDQPIVNTYASPNEEPSELEFYYPLSPHLALLITEKLAEPNGTRLVVDVDQVNRYNRHIVRGAFQQIYSESPAILERIRVGLYR